MVTGGHQIETIMKYEWAGPKHDREIGGALKIE